MQVVKRRPIVLASLAFVAIAFAACRAPTQVTVDIVYSGPTPCLTFAAIAVAVRATPEDAENAISSHEYTAQTQTCSADGSIGRFGTLVVTPGNESRAAITVVAAASNAALALCTREKNYASCIVARRVVTFANHTSLTLPISLDIECKDLPCSARSTCRRSECVPSDTTCENETCTLPDDAAQEDAGRDGVSPTDATTMPDAPTVDAAKDGGDAGPLVKSGACTGSQPLDAGGTATCPDSITQCPMGCCFVGDKWSCCADTEIRCGKSSDCPAGQICCTNVNPGSGGSGASCTTPTGGKCTAIGSSYTEACGGTCSCTDGKACLPSNVGSGNQALMYCAP